MHKELINRKLKMNKRFREIIEKLENTSDNFFVTGRAGTGKSTLLKFFKEKTSKNVAVLAPTGIAALNAGGQTIHSFFKFRPGITGEQIRRVHGQQALLYKNLHTIVIDEISMVRADILDLIDSHLQINGPHPGRPFGGVQMVFFGDLFQLPPVLTENEREYYNSKYEGIYFFNSASWKVSRFLVEELTDVFRQSDEKFISILDAIRLNDLNEDILRYVNSQVGASNDSKISLVTTNAKAEKINLTELGKINGKTEEYAGHITGDFMDKNLPTEETLKLKVGAQVMLLNNDQKKRWVNGDIAIVSDLDEDFIEIEMEEGTKHKVTSFTWESYRFSVDQATEKIKAESAGSFTQIPVKLAWAVTIHKGQGKTFEKASIDLGYSTFAPGQAYVALSRVKSLEGLSLKRALRRDDVFTDPEIIRFMDSLKSRSQTLEF